MSHTPYMDDEALHALIDGELDAEHARLVEARIDASPALARRVEGFRDDKKMLKTAFGPLIDRPIPEAWLALARGESHPPANLWRRHRQSLLAVAATLLIALFVGVGYVSLQPKAVRDVVQVALEARQDAVAPAKIFAIAAGDNTARFSAMLSEAANMKVKTPDLGRMGYRLASVRFYGDDPASRAAELVYRNPAGQVFTIYLRHSDGTVRFDQFKQQGLQICIWQDDQLAMVMAGKVTASQMQRLASLSYTGLIS